MKKKIFSFALAVILLISALPTSTAFAAEADEKDNLEKYTKDMLIANFEAARNSSDGTYRKNSTTWTDATGKYTATVHNYYDGCWTGNSLKMNGSLYLTFDAEIPENATVEIICNLDPDQNTAASASLFMSADGSTGVYRSGKSIYGRHHNGQKELSPTIDNYDGTPVVFMINGSAASLSYSDTTAWDTKYDSSVRPEAKLSKSWVIGGADAAHALVGEIYAIRIYGKRLSDEERLANTVLDYLNFFTENEDYQSKIMLHEQPVSTEDKTDHVTVSGNISNGLVLEDNKTYVFNHDVTISASGGYDPTITGARRSAAAVKENARVIILLENNATVTFKGSDGSGRTGGGAGIYVPASSTLIITGSGTVNAYGGKAGCATNGGSAENGAFSKINDGRIYAGNGGNGGNGGGGAGAGIGGYGGDGGYGGSGGKFAGRGGNTLNGHAAVHCSWDDTDLDGTNGSAGGSGSNGAACGKICILSGVTVNAVSGQPDNATYSFGSRGNTANDRGSGYGHEYSAGSSGAGAPGVGGRATLYGIGGGGAGGPAGGGGASGGTRVGDGEYKYPNGGDGGKPGQSGDSGSKGGSQRGGNGGAGGAYAESGANGSVYIDKQAKVSGRSCYYFDCSLFMMGDSVMASGIVQLKLGDGDSFTGVSLLNSDSTNNKAAKLAVALKEVKDHNAFWSYKIASAPASVDNYFSSSFCNGCYQVTSGENDANWYKEIIDVSDGYIYLLAEAMMDYFKQYFDDAYNHNYWYANPYDLVNVVFDSLKSRFPDIQFTEDMRTLLHVLFYHEPYGEPQDGERSGAGYVKDHQTNGSYRYHTDALKVINDIYMIVCDSNSPRSVSAFYDTSRKEGESAGFGWEHYYYAFNSKLTVIHGKVGINPVNWMSYLPNNMQISEVNMPGTHDSATAYISTPYVRYLAICQTMSIEEQMNCGLRLFDLWFKADGDEADPFRNMVLCHGPSDCLESKAFLGIAGEEITLDEVFEDGRAFLKDHPTEFLVFMYQQEGGDKDAFKKNEQAIRNILANQNDIVLLNDGDVMPKVSACRGKIVVLNSDHLSKYEDHYDVNASEKIKYLKEIFTASGLGKQNLNYSESRKVLNDDDNDKSVAEPKVIFTSSYSMDDFITEVATYFLPVSRLLKEMIGFEYTDLMKFGKFGELSDVERYATISTAFAILLSSAGLSLIPGVIAVSARNINLDGTPYTIAKDVNSYLYNVDFKEGRRYGWIAMNFPPQGVIERIYSSNDIDWDEMYKTMSDVSGVRKIASVFSEPSFYIIGGCALLIIAAIVVILIVRKKKKKKQSE